MPEAVLVLTSDGRSVLAANHAFLLLTGYSRSDVGDLRPASLFPDTAGEEALARILNAWGSADVDLGQVPPQTRQGDVVRVDVQARASRAPAEAILLQLAPSGDRAQAEQAATATAERIGRMPGVAGTVLRASTL